MENNTDRTHRHATISLGNNDEEHPIEMTFDLERIPDGEPCRVRITMPGGYVEAGGTADYVTQWFEDFLKQEGAYAREDFVRCLKSLPPAGVEQVAETLRGMVAAGIDEETALARSSEKV
jgi:hypothetical protein